MPSYVNRYNSSAQSLQVTILVSFSLVRSPNSCWRSSKLLPDALLAWRTCRRPSPARTQDSVSLPLRPTAAPLTATLIKTTTKRTMLNPVLRLSMVAAARITTTTTILLFRLRRLPSTVATSLHLLPYPLPLPSPRTSCVKYAKSCKRSWTPTRLA